MKVYGGLLLGCLLYSPSVLAKTDWTPVFASIQKDCDFHAKKLSNLFANLPAQYQSSVRSNRLSENKQYTITKITLNNAQAFGYPLTGIELGQKKVGLGDYLTLYFANKHFLQLKPKFYYALNDVKIYAGQQQEWSVVNETGEEIFISTDINGYDVGVEDVGVTLEFHPKSNALTCRLNLYQMDNDDHRQSSHNKKAR
ncbi:MAG: hypothetical protein Q4A69_00875 [Moraxella sp.]|nr:hypothetical protein [Moraxella sp.]